MTAGDYDGKIRNHERLAVLCHTVLYESEEKKLRMDLIMKISKLFARNFLNIINEHFKLEVMEPPVWHRETNGCTQGGHLVGWLNASAVLRSLR